MIEYVRDAPEIGDTRFVIAIYLLKTMAYHCPKKGVPPDPRKVRTWLNTIRNAIPDSLRWKGISPTFGDRIAKIDIKAASAEELKEINRVEELTIGFFALANLKTTDKSKLQQLFSDFLKPLGISYESYEDLAPMLGDLSLRVGRQHDDAIMTFSDLSSAAKENNLIESALYIGTEHIPKLNLSKLASSYIPDLYTGRPGERRNLEVVPIGQVNQPSRVCYGIPRAKSEIIDGFYKGLAFEKFLAELLTGKLITANYASRPFDGFLYQTDEFRKERGGSEIISALQNKTNRLPVWEIYGRDFAYLLSEPELKDWKAVKYLCSMYHYKLLPGRSSMSLTIREKTHPEFSGLLRQQKAEEWEEDVLLLHDLEPQHCLIAQSKFTGKYKHRTYLDGMRHVKETARFIEQEKRCRASLGIPNSYPIVPTLLSSFSGAIHKFDDDIFKPNLMSLASGDLIKGVDKFLDKN